MVWIFGQITTLDLGPTLGLGPYAKLTHDFLVAWRFQNGFIKSIPLVTGVFIVLLQKRVSSHSIPDIFMKTFILIFSAASPVTYQASPIKCQVSSLQASKKLWSVVKKKIGGIV